MVYKHFPHGKSIFSSTHKKSLPGSEGNEVSQIPYRPSGQNLDPVALVSGSTAPFVCPLSDNPQIGSSATQVPRSNLHTPRVNHLSGNSGTGV